MISHKVAAMHGGASAVRGPPCAMRSGAWHGSAGGGVRRDDSVQVGNKRPRIGPCVGQY